MTAAVLFLQQEVDSGSGSTCSSIHESRGAYEKYRFIHPDVETETTIWHAADYQYFFVPIQPMYAVPHKCGIAAANGFNRIAIKDYMDREKFLIVAIRKELGK
jgi:hypothetical protein